MEPIVIKPEGIPTGHIHKAEGGYQYLPKNLTKNFGVKYIRHLIGA